MTDPIPPEARLRRTRINLDSRQIEVEGIDITRAVTGLTLEIGDGWTPELQLSLALIEGGEVLGELLIYLNPTTRDVLTRWGWRPPGAPCQTCGAAE